MRVMVLVKASPESEAGEIPGTELLEAMGRYNEELAKAGVLLDLNGLHSSSEGARIRFSEGGKQTVIDGPFAESKELVAGYWVIQVKSKEDAIEWAKRAPFEPNREFEGEPELEVREIFDLEDFPDMPAIRRARELQQQLGKNRE